ncbi:hypothetical protein [Ochrobactrum soli]|uniref:Uncharacterized protein n=1 Tax=Ochrobactrum soli TaxID=2448455 RepID=A0A849KXH1_9HYPH|nr:MULTISPECIES: hypothetical protein [Brucella]NNU63358.1 hypothetical protein [[Ochrobactrum] soli]
MKTLFAFCQKTGRRLRQFVNRLITKLTLTGQLKVSVAISLPFIAKLEISYQTQLNGKADKEHKA